MGAKGFGCLKISGVFVFGIALFIGVEDYFRQQASKEICSKLKLGEEYVPPGEKEAIQNVIRTIDPFMSKRLNGTLDDPNPQGKAKRLQHPVTWGCLPAQLVVRNDLPHQMQTGLFKELGATFDVNIRTSHASFDPDSDPKVSSIALKVNISGLASSEPMMPLDDFPDVLQQKNKGVQDFVFISLDTTPVTHPATGIGDFANLHEAQMKNGINGVLLSMMARPMMFWTLLLGLLGGQRITVPFLIEHNTVHAHRFGSAGSAAKFVLKPCQDNIVKTMPDAPLGKKFFIEEMQAEHIKSHGACMDMFAQLQKDSCSTPIEDLSRAWDQQQAPLVPVAKLIIPKGIQSDTKSCESLTYSPWYGLAAHQPLGYVARGRREIYKEAAMLRLMKNSDV